MRALRRASVCVWAGISLFVGCSIDTVSLSPEQGHQTSAAMVSGTQQVTVSHLVAGRNIPMGQVKAWNDESSFHVEVIPNAGWSMAELQIHVATSPAGIPQTKKGNPIPGKFMYKKSFDPMATNHKYTMSLKWPVGVQVFVAVHADVIRTDEAGVAVESQGAWAKGDPFPGSNWATYFPDVIDKGMFVIIDPPKKR